LQSFAVLKFFAIHCCYSGCTTLEPFISKFVSFVIQFWFITLDNKSREIKTKSYYLYIYFRLISFRQVHALTLHTTQAFQNYHLISLVEWCCHELGAPSRWVEHYYYKIEWKLSFYKNLKFFLKICYILNRIIRNFWSYE